MTALHAFLTGALLAFGAVASQPLGAAQPLVAAQPPVEAQPPVRATDRPNGVAGDGQILARYVVEAISFKALNETGIDFLGSDEIVARFAIGDKAMATGIYSGVDTGETHDFRTQQKCIAPAIDPDQTRNFAWTCNSRGASGPFNFQITLYEYDGDIRKMPDFCISVGGDLKAGCAGFGSTTIGSAYVSLTEDELAALMPTVGTSVDRVVPIGSAYQVNIRLTRMRGLLVPPVGPEPPVGPVEPTQPCVPVPGLPCP